MAAAGEEGDDGQGDGPAGRRQAGAGGGGRVVGEVPQQQQMGEIEMKIQRAERNLPSGVQDLAVSPKSSCKFLAVGRRQVAMPNVTLP
jgi:hypothetical protein